MNAPILNERPILIVDGMNAFIRAFCAYPSMNVHGEQMGGVVGFMKILSRLVHEIQPIGVYIAWEAGGSKKRRKLFKEYKMNRKPADILNRYYEDDIPESDDNRMKQNILLIKLLRYAPACQIYVKDCEGDDVIAYLCRYTFPDRQKVIVSSDKDLYQLLDDRTKLYNLHKKTYNTKESVLSEFRVLSTNFGITKCLVGDKSDNIPGVEGLGFKTVPKLFPFLGTDNVLLSDVFDYCHTHIDEGRFFKKILEERKLVERNWDIINLSGGMLSSVQMSKVDTTVSTFKPKVDKVSFTKMLIDEGLSDFDVQFFFSPFNSVEGIKF